MPGPIVVPQRPVPKRQKNDGEGKPVQCWAHSKNGVRCKCLIAREPDDATPSFRNSLPVPMCQTHMRSGDGALKTVNHPLFGKILIARYDLPKGYRTAYWGVRKKARYATDDDGKVVEDRAVSFAPSGSYNGVIDPDGTDDIMQFASCPGPDERMNCRSTQTHFGWHNAGPETPVGIEFVTTQPIRKNEQFCHWYGPDWWSARNLKRANVSTSKYPAPLRVPKVEKKLAKSDRSGLQEMKKVIKGAIKKIEKKKHGSKPTAAR